MRGPGTTEETVVLNRTVLPPVQPEEAGKQTNFPQASGKWVTSNQAAAGQVEGR